MVFVIRVYLSRSVASSLARAVRRRALVFRVFIFISFSLIGVHLAFAAQPVGALTGRVTDQFGAIIINAAVSVADPNRVQRRTATDSEGRYTLSGLSPGFYVVRIEARGFLVFEQSEVEIAAGRRKELNAQLAVGLERQEVTVGASSELNTEPDGNRSALVLRDADLEALPDDPDELSAALQALAGVPVGPNGGQIVIDGFLNSGEPLPPRNSIREVRINLNPFSAENDRLGFGQIQIITRPGTDKLRGQAFLNFNDERFNSRNPFAPGRASYQMRNFGGNLSGSIVPRRASFFVTLDHRQTDDNAIINAVVLGTDLIAEPLNRTVLVPRRQINLTARFDSQLTPNHTLTARYSFYRNRTQNAGVGGVFLPERAFSFTLPIQTFQLTETSVLNTRLINEFRLQYIVENQVDEPTSTRPSVNVLGSFASGGSSSGRSSNPESRLTVQDSALWTVRPHTLRAGARLRRTTILDISPDDFKGTFIFAGGLAPLINAGGEPVGDSRGQTIPTLITSLERYRRTLLFSQRNLSPAEIRARGGGATQLVLGGGNARATARQVDFGAYFQDDWRMRPTFTLSFGLRTEFQTNIRFNLNLAPRVAFAWGLAGPKSSQPKAVIRGGFGVFFDRVNENQVLIANRFGAGDFLRFIITDPAILDSYPDVPSVATLEGANSAAQAVFRIADDLREPYMMQVAIGVERQLPLKTTFTASYIAARTLHALRTRNINAPVFVRNVMGEIIDRSRPNGEVGNIFQYESSGRLNQNQLFVTLNNRFSRRVTFFANYTFNKAMGNTDGVGTLPANSYDLSREYGRSSFDVRHTFSAGGTFDAALGLRFNPLIFASSGRPFNITTGTDANEDSVFTDRPAFALDLMKPGIRITQFGAFDPAPGPGEPVVLRNFGVAPGYLIVNLNVSRTLAFGRRHTSSTTQGRQPGVSGGGATNESRYRLTLGVRILNLFNRNNLDLPVGNLSSPFFGQSVSTAGGFGAASVGNPAAGNRRVETQVRFEF